MITLGPRWEQIALSIFFTVLFAAIVGGDPVLGFTEDGDMIFAIGVHSHD